MPADHRQFAPATQRNKTPILEVLKRYLPPSGTVLEIGSGTGEHAVYFAGALPALVWQPTEKTVQALASIEAWRQHANVLNMNPPIRLDVNAPAWPVTAANAIVCINVIHYSPWQTTLDLLDGAQRLLPSGGILYLYGPYRRGGEHTAESNAAFDDWLKQRDPRFAVRNLETVQEEATLRGFETIDVIDMPANNVSVVLRRL